jgi:hypothetical protein
MTTETKTKLSNTVRMQTKEDFTRQHTKKKKKFKEDSKGTKSK